MKTSEVLDKAADEIERRGWVQGTGWLSPASSPADPVCLEGAIMAAIGMRIDEDESVDDTQFTPLVTCPAYRAMTDYLGRLPVTANPSGFEGQPLYWWNDEDAVDADHVVEVLRAAAMVERTKEAAELSPQARLASLLDGEVISPNHISFAGHLVTTRLASVLVDDVRVGQVSDPVEVLARRVLEAVA